MSKLVWRRLCAGGKWHLCPAGEGRPICGMRGLTGGARLLNPPPDQQCGRCMSHPHAAGLLTVGEQRRSERLRTRPRGWGASSPASLERRGLEKLAKRRAQ